MRKISALAVWILFVFLMMGCGLELPEQDLQKERGEKHLTLELIPVKSEAPGESDTSLTGEQDQAQQGEEVQDKKAQDKSGDEKEEGTKEGEEKPETISEERQKALVTPVKLEDLSGTFAEGTEAGLKGQAHKNGIKFTWKPKEGKTAPCSKICLASVFYITDKNGKVLKYPMDAYMDSAKPETGGKEYVKEGYLVDSPLVQLKDVSDAPPPCKPTSDFTATTGLLVGEDSPHFTKQGYIVHFETCAICLKKHTKKDPKSGKTLVKHSVRKILQCMQWTTENQEKAGVSKLKLVEKKIDQNAVTTGYKKAIEHFVEKLPYR